MDKKMQDMLARIDDVLRPHRALQEQMERFLEPQRRFQEEMNRLLEPQLRLQEQMKRYLEPYAMLQQQMQRYLEPQRELQEHMKKYLEPSQRVREQLERYLEPQRQLQAQINRYLAPYQTLERHLEPYRSTQEQIGKYLSSLNQYLSDPLMDRMSFSEDGGLSVAGELVDTGELEKSLGEIASEAYSSTEEFLESLFRLLEKLSAAARIVLIYLILPYLLAIVANLTTPMYEEWWKEYAHSDHRVAKKEIVREANSLYHPEELEGYRFVHASVLHVRSAGTLSADLVDELYLGKTVRILEKARRWSLIEYQDSEAGEIKQGWVFSRYLEKFNK